MSDPMGQAVYDFYHSGKAEMIIVDSNYTEGEEMDPAIFFRGIAEMSAIEVTALDHCRGSVIDVGAGAGCHALELQNRNLRVTAVDKSELSCEVMRERGIREVICSDIFDITAGRYDTILMLMNGTGIAGTLEGLSRLLRHLKILLAPGGQILLDSSDISYLFTEEDGSVWIDLSRENYYGEMIYEMTYENVRSEKFFWLFVDCDTLCETAIRLGFSCTRIADGENGEYLARLLPAR